MNTVITRDLLKTLRADIDAALAAVGEKHGVVLSAGSASFSPSTFHFRLEGSIKGGKTREEETYDANAPLRGLPARGTEFTSGGHRYAISGMTTAASVLCTRRRQRQGLSLHHGRRSGLHGGGNEGGMRALINQVSGGGVVLQYDDALSGVRVERAFVCDDRPHAYVRELLPGGGTRQPCDALDTRGATLTCNGRADLLAVIRHEYRAMRRQERRLARHQERRW